MESEWKVCPCKLPAEGPERVVFGCGQCGCFVLEEYVDG